jgi:hypothetical protein
MAVVRIRKCEMNVERAVVSDIRSLATKFWSFRRAFRFVSSDHSIMSLVLMWSSSMCSAWSLLTLTISLQSPSGSRFKVGSYRDKMSESIV